ncbi:MurR/RpiR family transcriptional regulator [Clostridium sp. 19966]|uniref:MurR/RpiR family transcriptional regulator n=1 Tax=Clostridium sp. 19966 TaxID=2768166 RepID=UPI0028DF558F|nr:MurR/RpiR family transcriptional regulator [Clostridium sp. 19966]MDT8717873.1 MurR/RpiR family transcriptional regulator [Clostridium sp. 19966]
MGCLYKIKSFKNFTKTEEKLAKYITENVNGIIYDSVQDIAAKADISPAAVIRFSKKLGYNGFAELKIDLAKDNTEEVPLFSEKICQKDSLKTIVKKSKASDASAVEQTYKLLRIETLNDAVQAMKNAKRIYLFGIGSSGICCYDLAQKLSRVGYNAVFYNDFHIQLAASNYISKDDVALAVSYSGNTKEINVAMEYAKDQGATTISITQFTKSPLLKFSDLALYIPSQEKDLRLGAVSSRNASLILTDLLYLGMITDELDENKKNLISSRTLVNKLRL